MQSKKWRIQIFHLVTDTQSEIPRKCFELVSVRYPEKFYKPIVRPMFEVQYIEFRRKLSRRNNFTDDNHNVMMFANNRYVLMSELMELLNSENCPVVILNEPHVEFKWTENLLKPELVNPERDYIFLNIFIERKHDGFLIIEVFTDINPKVSKHFVQMFTNETPLAVGHYHVFKDGWFEFGVGPKAMPMRGHNHHPEMSHNRRGIVSFNEEFNLECDPFFIHFVPCLFFDDLRTVLGRVVHGDSTLNRMEQLETEFGKIEKKVSIRSYGIVPIGRNIPEDADEEWERVMNYLFKESNVAPKSFNSESDIACPLFQDQGEGSGVPTETSEYSTADTVQSWMNYDCTAMTLFYDESSEVSVEHSSSSVKSLEETKPHVQHSYSNELSLHGELDSRKSSIECINEEKDRSLEEEIVKKNVCPSFHTDISY